MIRIEMAALVVCTILASLVIGVDSAITQTPSSGDCLCATTNVNGRSSASVSGTVLKVLRASSNDCGAFLGGITSNGGYIWYELTFESQTVWVVGNYLDNSAHSMCGMPSSGDCLCATTTVNARSSGSLSGSILKVLSANDCGPSLGGITGGNGYIWYQLTFDSQTVWVAANFLQISQSSLCSSGNQCPTIVSRSQWGARTPTEVTYLQNQPVTYAFIHHSDTSGCTSESSCISRVKGFQNYHMDTRGWSDIGYSFLIGGDGKVYEGRGWDRVGAHTSGYNSVGLGFCFIGDFQSQSPSQLQIDVAQQLLACGQANGKLKSDYILKGHRDVVSTTCPGDQLYSLIQSWAHYSG